MVPELGGPFRISALISFLREVLGQFLSLNDVLDKHSSNLGTVFEPRVRSKIAQQLQKTRHLAVLVDNPHRSFSLVPTNGVETRGLVAPEKLRRPDDFQLGVGLTKVGNSRADGGKAKNVAV